MRILTPEEYQAINIYTSEAYTEINGYLRTKGKRVQEGPPSNPEIEKISTISLSH
ncbi:ADP-ribosyltransferase [Bacillus xiapuensis]|uniref:ADP-ribosyltransferase n=1 Tax=Bacillus xiapuensis TaxID=2014075 RepID=UPI0012FE2BC6|nr:ADP-ribosyltransferase [Bacillus xiapuensis]